MGVLTTQILGFVGQGMFAGRPFGSAPLERRRLREPVRAAAAPGILEDAATLRSDAKAKLLELIEDENVGTEVLRPEGKSTRGRVDECIVALERLNPDDEPVYSELLDGTWRVQYTGTYAPGLLSSPTRELALFLYGGGFSLGNALSSFAGGFWGQSLGVNVGNKTVRIRGGRDIDASAEITVSGRKMKLTYTAELMPLSSARMSEEVVSFEFPNPVGRQDASMELRRNVLVTYLDEEFMVVRDESGVPEVLLRELVEVTAAAAPETLAESAPSAAAVAGNATTSVDDTAGDEAATPA